MILLDFSQICIAAIFADKGFQEAAKTPSQESKLLLKHMIMNSIRSYSQKNKVTYGTLVLCVDSDNSWRKDYFQFYKAGRKKGRDESPVNWEFVYEVLHETLDDLKENFPYPVLKYSRLEGDDLIAIAAKYITETKTKQVGLYEESEPILIISSDRDYVQLQKLGDHVKQFDPRTKKLVEVESASNALIEKIVTGDSGDGVPNILSDDDTFVSEEKRQRPLARKRLPDFFAKGIEACVNDTERRNYQRNQTVISFDCIPEEYRQPVIDQLETQLAKKPNRMKMMNYFIANGMKHLLEVVDQF